MSGETDLAAMLASLEVVRRPGVFVYVCLPPGAEQLPGVSPHAVVAEDEGMTLVVEQSEADAAGLAYDFEAAWLSLTVNSSLEAVGLTAAFSGALAGAGIPANVVAGFHHDHILVPVQDAGRAVDALHGLRKR